MSDGPCTKVMAEAIAGSIGLKRDELDKARVRAREAEAAVQAIEIELADREAWLARIIEGVPMAKINAADKATPHKSEAEETK